MCMDPVPRPKGTLLPPSRGMGCEQAHVQSKRACALMESRGLCEGLRCPWYSLHVAEKGSDRPGGEKQMAETRASQHPNCLPSHRLSRWGSPPPCTHTDTMGSLGPDGPGPLQVMLAGMTPGSGDMQGAWPKPMREPGTLQC